MYHDAVAIEAARNLVDRYKIKTVFETGSYYGRGTLFFSELVPTVVSVDVDEHYWNLSACTVRSRGNRFETNQPGARTFYGNGKLIVLCHGNSPQVLASMLALKCFEQPFLFYLDAHWNDYWPLLDEIRTIACAGVPQSVIIVHDIQVPGTDFGYDTYKGQPLSLEYVKPELLKVNPNFRFEFNKKVRIIEPAQPRGILYVTPD